ncbi:MAG TPA: DUF2955 domain-containing protein, partial [Cellvibrio sp.]|nr:DUF2955 domain-containing protein [Cellvibrio sp.]
NRLASGSPALMPLGARRTFRFGSVVAISLLLAYAFGAPMPFFTPLFAIILTSIPGPPIPVKGAIALLLLASISLGFGIALIPLLQNYPAAAVMLIAVGLFVGTYLAVAKGKVLPSTFLTMGLAIVPAAGLANETLASTVISAILVGIILTVISQWLVYPLFPEDPAEVKPKPPPAIAPEQAQWQALRATLIVMPAVMLAFTNPAFYIPAIMKSVLMGQQSTETNARAFGRELLESTFLAGLFSILFWFALKMWPNLWMYFLWMLLLSIYIGSKLFGVSKTRFPPSFWINVLVTLLILVGPALEDIASGKDVYKAFAMRFSLFVVITLYAWLAILALEWFRKRLT